jgi:hypothetical protein
VAPDRRVPEAREEADLDAAAGRLATFRIRPAAVRVTIRLVPP